MLAVVKAGAAYLSIDADYPAARRELMARDGDVRFLVTHDGWGDRAFEGVEAVEWAFDAADDAPPVDVRVEPEDTACVLYTSGSTGEPKGIVFEHRNIAALAVNPSLPKLGADDKVGQISSISFDGITLEVWAALAAGAEVVVLPRMSSLLPVDLKRELKRRKVSMMLVPATVLNELCRVDRDTFAALRHLCSGGDVILPATCRALLGGKFSGDLYNLYGPSEITTAATAHRIVELPDDAAAVPIGTAIDGYETYVVDADRHPVPRGEQGELLIGGVGVARGYLGPARLTAERFVPNPFGAPGTRVYTTGDRVRENADGELEFLGRLDNQYKIRGHRVEPAEVERALSRHPHVRQAAVLVEEVDGDHRLGGFVVPATADLSTVELREFLVDRVPEHMIPASLTVIKTMPTTRNGKRDWDALTELRRQARARLATRVEPDTDTERWLVELWERLLGVDSVGAEDDFFELGGHSLLAFRARMAVVREFGVQIDSHILFEHSTLRALAGVIEEARK
jgi:amino acid adenylation domain-containing protein